MIKKYSIGNDRLTVCILVALLLGSFLVKAVRFSDPYFGSHIFRQLQTMSTIEDYMANGIDLKHPKANYEGYPGYIIAELPLFQALAAAVSQITQRPLESTRFLNLVLAALTIAVVMAIAAAWFSNKVVWYSALFFAFSPLNIMFHRSTMADILSTLLVLTAFLIYLRDGAEKSTAGAVAFLAVGALGALIKPLYFLPVAALFVIRYWQDNHAFDPSAVSKYCKRHKNIVICFILVGAALAVWMSASGASSSTLRHIGWGTLIQPKFYLNIVIRFCTQFLNPLTVLLFGIGVLWLWKTHRKNERIALLAVPIAYYALFPDINLPHAYYSLILIPFFSITAGCGAVWLEDAAVQQGLVKSAQSVRIPVFLLASFFSVYMFVSNITDTMVLPEQRYARMSEEVRPYVQPMQYSLVYVNRNALFAAEENFRNRPFTYFKSFFKNLSARERLGQERDHPLVRSAVMYAVRQYGEMEYIDSPAEVNVEEQKERYQGQLRYILYYLMDDQKEIINNMKPYIPIYQSKDWVIFEVKNKG